MRARQGEVFYASGRQGAAQSNWIPEFPPSVLHDSCRGDGTIKDSPRRATSMISRSRSGTLASVSNWIIYRVVIS